MTSIRRPDLRISFMSTEPLKLQHPRDLSAWKQDGIEFSSTSNEVAKLFDVLMYQSCSLTPDKRYGGIVGTFKSAAENDPNFVLLQVLNHFETCACSQYGAAKNEAKQKALEFIEEASARKLTDLERRHVKALEKAVEGKEHEAFEIWFDILTLYPKDLCAMRYAFEHCLFYGKSRQMRSALSTVLPAFKRSDPYYPFILSRLAFSINECHDTVLGEKLTREALEINCQDSWAFHTMAHVFDIKGDEKGADFMDSRSDQWRSASFLSCHNLWHTALMYINMGDFDNAVRIYDTEMLPLVRETRGPFQCSDAASLLFRLQVQGHQVPMDLWCEIADIIEESKMRNCNNFGYYDGVFALCLAKVATDADSKATRLESAYDDFIDNLQQYTSSDETRNDAYATVVREVGLNTFKAAGDYFRGDYSSAVKLLYPKRFDIYKLGGSHAQRDVFHQMLCDALFKSDDSVNIHRVKNVLKERQLYRNSCGFTERFLERLNSHDH